MAPAKRCILISTANLAARSNQHDLFCLKFIIKKIKKDLI